MTENEAIKYAREYIKYLNYSGWEKDFDAIQKLIIATEENQQYRAIGTVEDFKALKEKSVAKKPDYEGDGYYNGQIVLDTWICPNCGKHYEVDYDDYEHCPNCGQHIDHSELTVDD